MKQTQYIAESLRTQPTNIDDVISEAISVSVSDGSNYDPAVADPSTFDSEPQPRLPLFHDDEDYYEVDLDEFGDDEFVLGEL